MPCSWDRRKRFFKCCDRPDGRSVVELSLCEEVIETAEELFKGLDYRLNERGMVDKLTVMST
jgi:hypothetical protein